MVDHLVKAERRTTPLGWPLLVLHSQAGDERVFVAWSATLILVALLLRNATISVIRLVGEAVIRHLSWLTVIQAIVPVVIPLSVVAALIAIVSTVAIFLRTRTATLREIQLRLAALEEEVLSRESDQSSN